MPGLPRPVVLLEDGRGAAGRARLAWGAHERWRLDWAPDAVGELAWLGREPKVALVATFASESHDADPMPEVPEC